MKITFEISVEEFVKLGGILFTGKDELKLESGKPLLELAPEEDLKILAELKEKLSEDEQPEDPALEQTTSKVEVLIDGEGWKQFEDIDKAAKAIDARKEHLLFALENDKTCNGMQVRYYNPKKKKAVSTKYTKTKVKKCRKEHPDKVIEIYDSISKCAKLNNLKYANLFQQLKKHKKYEYGLYVFQLTEEIDDTMEEIEKKSKEPYEISKNK